VEVRVAYSTRATPKARQALGLLACALLTFTAAALGAIASANAPEFYAMLSRPPWAPPSWLFGPVWTALYLLMAIAAWLVWRRAGFAGARAGLVLFVVQLGANSLWSWLFFRWHQGALAFVDVVLLWWLILMTIVAFHRVSTLAAMLLYPYLAWTTYAAALTFSVWRLNPTLL
jgi:tryptophan-rich sensory protein